MEIDDGRYVTVLWDDVDTWIATEQGRLPGVVTQETEQDPDGGGLAGAVRAEKTVDFSGGDFEIQPVEGEGLPERLDQPGDGDGSGHDSAMIAATLNVRL